MKTSLFIVACLLLSIVTFAQTTICFVQTKQIENGHKQMGDRSVLFLSITSMGCYDSDKDGISVGNGFLKYVETKDGIKNYRGDSYWGDAIYRLRFDYSKLNVVDIQSGIIYVYEKRDFNEVASTTSSNIRKKSPSQSSNPEGQIVVVPTVNRNGHTDDLNARTTCYVCKGTKREKYYITSAASSIVKKYEHCSECNEMMREYNLHRHRLCTVCKGKGYY